MTSTSILGKLQEHKLKLVDKNNMKNHKRDIKVSPWNPSQIWMNKKIVLKKMIT